MLAPPLLGEPLVWPGKESSAVLEAEHCERAGELPLETRGFMVNPEQGPRCAGTHLQFQHMGIQSRRMAVSGGPKVQSASLDVPLTNWPPLTN